MGNKDFEKACDSIKEIIDGMEMPEVKYFVEEFMPAYRLTLDDTK